MRAYGTWGYGESTWPVGVRGGPATFEDTWAIPCKCEEAHAWVCGSILNSDSTSHRERQTLHGLTCGLQTGQPHRNGVERWVPGAGRGREWADVGQRIQASCDKTNAFRGRSGQPRDYRQ